MGFNCKETFCAPLWLLALYLALAACSSPGPDQQPASGNKPTATISLKELANSGDVSAEYTLGFCYESPGETEADDVSPRPAACREQSIPVDNATAAFWYRKAAEQDHADAQFRLARLYDTGKGVALNYSLAAVWYRQAAERGVASAQNSLGDLYGKGQGVARDFAEAMRWFQKAADGGNAYAFNNLGLMYFNGQGVPKDDWAAARWYAKSPGGGIRNSDKDGNPHRFICHYGRETHPGYTDGTNPLPPPDDQALQFLGCPDHVGLIDRTGKILLPPVYGGVGDFASNGLAPVVVGLRWGFIDRNGHLVIAPQYDEVSVFDEERIAAVMNADGTYDLIDDSGKNITAEHFEAFDDDGHNDLRNWRHGYPLRHCCSGDKAGLPEALPLVRFVQGLLPVRKKGLWGYIDSKGRWIIRPQFAEAEVFAYNGLAAVKEGLKWGYIDMQGKMMLPPQYDDARPFTASGLAVVKLGELYGYIDHLGTIVIAPRFNMAFDFGDTGDTDYARVLYSDDDQEGVIDLYGQITSKPIWWSKKTYPFGDGPQPARIDAPDNATPWGYTNRRHEFVIPPQFSDAGVFAANGMARIRQANDPRWAYINEKLDLVLPPHYDCASDFADDGLAYGSVGDHWGFFDATGSFRISSPYPIISSFSAAGYARIKAENGCSV